MGQGAPKVTVIIPVYNVELYLEKCLQSVITQSLEELEIICVNDGSTDHSSEILNYYAFKDSRIHIISQENSGLSASRNKGMKYANGEYLYFLDSDDYIAENAMEYLYGKAEAEKAEIIYFNTNLVFDSEELRKRYSNEIQYYEKNYDYVGIKTGREMLEDMFNHNDYQSCCPLEFFQHSFLKNNDIKFREGIIYEDNLFTIEAALKAKRVLYVDQRFYNRRQREKSITTLPKSFKNYKGYYECMQGVQLLMDEFEKELTKGLQRHLRWLVGFFGERAEKVYLELDDSEKEKVFHYKNKSDENSEEIGFSIIVSINKKEMVRNILFNYKRQEWKKRELILVLNTDSILLDEVRKMTRRIAGVSVYQLDEGTSLSECLNFGIEKAKFDYIVRFNENHYYTSKYLCEAAQLFQTKECQVVGKDDIYVYFMEAKILCKWKEAASNVFVNQIQDGTIICKKDIASKIGFEEYGALTENKFLQKVREAGYKIYSGSDNNYLCIRYLNQEKYTWRIELEHLANSKNSSVWEQIEFAEALHRISKIL